jgi:hypothetical protein
VTNPLLVRLLFAGLTTAVIAVGEAWVVVAGAPSRRFNAIFMLWLLIGAIPALVYAVGVRNRHRVFTFGSLLLGITAGCWTVAALSRNQFALVLPLLGFLATLATSMAGASDHRTI